MRKIRLDVDALRVESFAAEVAEAEARGTVEGRQIGTQTARTGGPGCPGCQESGCLSCVSCPAPGVSESDCSYTNGADICYW